MPENPSEGIFISMGSGFYRAKIAIDEHNSLTTSFPSPGYLASESESNNWTVKSLMLHYSIHRNSPGDEAANGGIDIIGINDDTEVLHWFKIILKETNAWKALDLQLPSSMKFRFGLSVSIHVGGSVGQSGNTSSPLTVINIASIGLRFIKI